MTRDEFKQFVPAHWRGPAANHFLTVIRSKIAKNIACDARSIVAEVQARAIMREINFPAPICLASIIDAHRAEALEYAEYLFEFELKAKEPRRRLKRWREPQRIKPATIEQLAALRVGGILALPSSRLHAHDQMCALGLTA